MHLQYDNQGAIGYEAAAAVILKEYCIKCKHWTALKEPTRWSDARMIALHACDIYS
eukprot:COSAG05_NODE_1365_length_5065_cov_3.435360_5_plen_56_part_00